MKGILAAVMFITLHSIHAFAQCACMGGAAVGGLTPIGGTVNVGVLREGYGRLSTYYRYAAGSTTLAGSERVMHGQVTEYSTQYIGITLGYGVRDDFTVESELGHFPNKYQNFATYSLEGTGFSHVGVTGKYNAWNDIAGEWEATIGIGARMPLTQDGLNLPQHILPSTGSYSGNAQIFLHKGWREHGLLCVLLHRTDVHAVNALEYHYGTSISNAIIVGKTLTPALVGLLEIRHDYRLTDRYRGILINSTGGSVLALAPQINVLLDAVNVSLVLDYPVYRHYNGSQLANDYALGMNITWQPQLSGE